MLRRSSFAALLVAGLAVPAVAASTAPAFGAQISQLTFAGEIAFGEWSTCPTWRVGDQCLFTAVTASNARMWDVSRGSDSTPRDTRSGRARSAIVLRHFWFEVAEIDGELSAVPRRESFGQIGVPAFPGSAGNPVTDIDTQLRQGTARATEMHMVTTEYTAGDPITTSELVWVSTTWAGSGSATRVSEGSVIFGTDRSVVRESTTGWRRDVEASGSGSLAVEWGTFLGGYLFHGQQDRTVGYRGQSTGQVSAAINQLSLGVPDRSAVVGRSRSTTSYGEAAWTTCPMPQAGDRCRDVFIWLNAVVPGTDEYSQRTGIEIYEYDVVDVVDGWVDARPVASVTTTAAASSLWVEADLSRAAITVDDADATLCEGESDCAATTVSFSATWTGVGTQQPFSSHGMRWGDAGREWFHVDGARRSASATAIIARLPDRLEMNGPVTGDPRFASLAMSQQRHQTQG